jgi:hypothetical protein
MTTLLACVPKVARDTLEQWVRREFVTFSHPARGRGIPVPRTGLDVLQVATFARLTSLGIPPGGCQQAWPIVSERACGLADHAGVVLFVDARDSFIVAKPYGDAGLEAVLAASGDPDTIALLRIPPHIERVVGRIASIAARGITR